MRLNRIYHEQVSSFVRLCYLGAFFIAISVPNASSDSPLSKLRRMIPERFQGRWDFRRPLKTINRGQLHQSDLEVSESRQYAYETLDRKLHPPPAPRRPVRRTHIRQPQKLRAQEVVKDLETAADSPYHVTVGFPHSHGPPYHHHGPPYHHHEPEHHHIHIVEHEKGHSKGHKKGYSKGPPHGYSKGPPHVYSSGPPEGYSQGPPKGYSKGPPQYIHDYSHLHHSEHHSYEGEGWAPGAPGDTPSSSTPSPPSRNTTRTTNTTSATTESPEPPEIPGICRECICADEIGDRNITKPEDLEPSWFLMDEMKNHVDPLILLNPPLILVPPSPEQISSDSLDKYETVYIERLSLDFEEAARNAGYSVVRDRITSLSVDTSTALPPPMTSSDALSSVVTIRGLPRLHCPLKGNENDRNNINFFKAGLNQEVRRRRRRETRSPVDNFIHTDLHTMTNLFQELWDFEMKPEEIEVNLASKNGSPEVLQMPMIVSRNERFSIPEPDHSERTVLDASFNFGLPASSNQFESHSRVVEEWKQMMGVGRSKFLTTAEDFAEVYTGMAQFYESLEEFARARTILMRNFGAASFIAAEDVAQSSFNVRQFLICTDRDNDPTCENRCNLDPIAQSNKRTDGRSGSATGLTRPTREQRQRSRGQKQLEQKT